MPLTPPNASTALADTNSNEATIVSDANTAFIQAITVLIENAIATGTQFSISPPIPTNADYNSISTYFTNIGYTVTLTLPPIDFFSSDIPPGFITSDRLNPFWDPSAPPPAYPSDGWIDWQKYVQSHHPRMVISWAP